MSDKSIKFFECPIKESCLGENRKYSEKNLYIPYLAIGLCKIGYKGIVCAECIEDYGKIIKWKMC